jgi:hypothetical protein
MQSASGAMGKTGQGSACKQVLSVVCIFFYYCCCAGRGYSGVFSEVLTVYQIYCTWSHPLATLFHLFGFYREKTTSPRNPATHTKYTKRQTWGQGNSSSSDQGRNTDCVFLFYLFLHLLCCVLLQYYFLYLHPIYLSSLLYLFSSLISFHYTFLLIT